MAETDFRASYGDTFDKYNLFEGIRFLYEIARNKPVRRLYTSLGVPDLDEMLFGDIVKKGGDVLHPKGDARVMTGHHQFVYPLLDALRDYAMVIKLEVSEHERDGRWFTPEKTLLEVINAFYASEKKE